MSANRHLAAAALLAALAAACSAAAAQTMYRCGNQFQDKPCQDGQKGGAVGSTRAPASAPAAGKNRPASPSSSTQRPKAASPTQATAMTCARLRDLVSQSKPRQKEQYQEEMRKEGCAYPVDGGVQKEDACAKASPDKAREACAPYAKRR